MTDFDQKKSEEATKMSPNEFIRKALQEVDEDVLREEIEAGESDGENKPMIETFENGQPTEVREGVTTPTVKIPEVAPVEQSKLGEPVEATKVGAEIPTGIQQVDQKITTEVEGPIQSKGGDIQQLGADASTKTELPQGEEELVAKHNNFIRGAGEAATPEASEMEEIWDPPEENQTA